jgi:anti-sigma factor RsiW
VENLIAILDPRLLARARNRLGLELLALVAVVLGLGALAGLLLSEVSERGALSLVPAVLVLAAASWPLATLLRVTRDVPDLLARHYLLLEGRDEVASSSTRRRPWRDAIASL